MVPCDTYSRCADELEEQRASTDLDEAEEDWVAGLKWKEATRESRRWGGLSYRKSGSGSSRMPYDGTVQAAGVTAGTVEIGQLRTAPTSRDERFRSTAQESDGEGWTGTGCPQVHQESSDSTTDGATGAARARGTEGSCLDRRRRGSWHAVSPSPGYHTYARRVNHLPKKQQTENWRLSVNQSIAKPFRKTDAESLRRSTRGHLCGADDLMLLVSGARSYQKGNASDKLVTAKAPESRGQLDIPKVEGRSWGLELGIQPAGQITRSRPKEWSRSSSSSSAHSLTVQSWLIKSPSPLQHPCYSLVPPAPTPPSSHSARHCRKKARVPLEIIPGFRAAVHQSAKTLPNRSQGTTGDRFRYVLHE
ncbi:hypothetical protein VTN00DRAFT_4682 [Thermoascus crustaceus]|uniref:uncharacterized protein n=1 Tax=Thermoascus crustaceus TaxID=5088 RepID=UPI003744A95C